MKIKTCSGSLLSRSLGCLSQSRFLANGLGFAFLFLLLSTPTSVFGQRGQFPDPLYYRFFGEFYRAEYRDAGKNFTRGGNNMVYRLGTQRYLDSICFWTMMGECHYHLGNYADAIQMYEQSLDLYLTFQTYQWQVRLQDPGVIQEDNNAANRARINWGNPSRKTRFPRMPGTFPVLFGRLDSERAIQEGGLVDNAEIKQIDVTEIMRCAALCLHRRRVIKGPTSKYDPFSVRLINGLNVAGAGNGTLVGAYNGVLLGIARASMDDWDRAASILNKSLQFNRGMDHPLTPVALVELANIGIETGNLDVAAKLALEASYSAAVFNQFDLIEESLSLGTKIHLARNKSPYPPLEAAIAWANREKARMMQASLLVKLAECYAEAGDAKSATAVLRQTNGAINSRNSLGVSVVSARMKYVSAITRFLNADFSTGMSELGDALARFQNGSLWIYRLALADKLVISNKISERHADLLYGALLHDPTDTEWRMDPMEAIAFLASDHVGPMERWFDIVLNRKDMDRAINISELVRRHRFFSTLPLGGRLTAFRWVIHAPDKSLTTAARKQREEFLNRYPKYRQLQIQGDQIRNSLVALPVEPDAKSPEEREQAKLYRELADISNLQEAMLASFALRREPAELMFPPQFQLSEFRNFIGQDQLALVTLATSSGYHMFFVNSNSVRYLGVADGRVIKRGLGQLLKSLGLTDSAIDVDMLKSEDWKTLATEMTNQLFGNVPGDAWGQVRDLVIVPDGLFWYMPFELLQIGSADSQNLAEVVDIRYSPTLFLAFDPQRKTKEISRTGVVLGRLHPKLEPEVGEAAFTEMTKEMPDAVRLQQQLRVPSNLLGAVLDQLVVWSEIRQSKNTGPLATSPITGEQTKSSDTLGQWMSLPWQGPEHMIFAGYNSDAGSGLKGINGRDLFLTTMGLMASGTRSILISRWRMGGENSLALTRNYATKVASMSGARALRESVAVARELDIDYEKEPRIRSKKSDGKMKADHPSFWAGFIRLEILDDRDPDPIMEEDPVAPGNQPGDENEKPDDGMDKNEKDEIDKGVGGDPDDDDKGGG